jgi:hypothetical protein
MRTVDISRELNRRIICEDREIQKYNAAHHYKILDNSNGDILANINFQEGPIKEVGLNGITEEELIHILIDRYSEFQKSEFNCIENEESINLLVKILDIQRTRTNDRKKRNVEGTYKV